MVDSKESFHESLIIRRAKRRLIGAITILIILFTLSLFFIKNKSQVGNIDEIKISFLEMGKASFSDKKNKEESVYIKSDLESIEKNKNGLFTVQIGIFSDEKKIKQLSNQINNIGFKTQIKKINLSGEEKIKLTTQSFSTEKEAQGALRKLKNANFPGLIKRN